MNDQLTTGQCLCRAVKFRISGTFEAFFLCHCSRCRKDTGTAHAANLFSSKATITWLSGTDRISTFTLPGSRHAKSFCSTCGAALPMSQTDGGFVVVPAGCLDSPIDLRPTAHICMADRATWDNDLEAIPRMDGLPG